ncbi:uncharacterized protein LOC132276089 [Cornus florida]|uniref:uncharacterized protein LOC132276089 n=1 Tax=Cornus florida TaxID=4283 RepID=UPI0028A2DA18|nr:uncharacterized protein LOC132276089 [Cornus florida]XP_059633331.1 uncharacterized protein LOC132276089 [Cornus florida]XP_059633333.1 uncharacterized protein LOC132276089 [Cornus florida]XP_059633334.1 uncharacterized protein LOC132276089 [Cornus florida]XP_059633335.1 uncharacterized protein LOC132276089 [Cornus florida]
MNSLCNSIHNFSLKPLSSSSSLLTSPLLPHKTQFHILTPTTKSKTSPLCLIYKIPSSALPKWQIKAMSDIDIDMVRNKEGVYAAKPRKVVVLWDLDNKPPRGPPYQAAMALKQVAQQFGEVVDFSAYANRHAFVHLPQWVLEERRQRRHQDVLERKGVAKSPEPYVCAVCGRKFSTNMDLKKHFRQLHERERQKKLNRMKSLKGKKRQRYKQRFIDGNRKYNEAARTLVTPKVGYGLASELRRAGVYVKTVEDKPQAADWALKRQMQHSMSRGIDWLFLVSDDSDFSEMLRKAREANLRTVVVGDGHRSLGRNADLWVPWIGIENGQVSAEELVARSRRRSDYIVGDADEPFSTTHFDFDGRVSAERNLDSVMDQLVTTSRNFDGVRTSAFSEGEEEEEDWTRGVMNQEDNGRIRVHQSRGGGDDDEEDDDEDDFLLDSDDEETEEDEAYF